jgi:hypothetical protein
MMKATIPARRFRTRVARKQEQEVVEGVEAAAVIPAAATRVAEATPVGVIPVEVTRGAVIPEGVAIPEAAGDAGMAGGTRRRMKSWSS